MGMTYAIAKSQCFYEIEKHGQCLQAKIFYVEQTQSVVDEKVEKFSVVVALTLL